MRVGEALRLDRDDVDLDDGVLTVRDTKFGKSREVPLHPSTVDALAATPQPRPARAAARATRRSSSPPPAPGCSTATCTRPGSTLVRRAGLAAALGDVPPAPS